MLEKITTKFFAFIMFLPFCFLASPVIFYTDWRYGRKNILAKKAQDEQMKNNWLLKPFLWCHRVLCCNNDSMQRW